MRKFAFAAILSLFSAAAFGDGAVIQGELSAGVYKNVPVDSSGYLFVNCPGCTGAAAPTGANNADAVASVTTGLSSNVNYLFGYNGATWDRLLVDASKNLKINCVTGCSAGSGTGLNNADGVATVGTGLGSSVSYLYGYNGTTMDRLRVDGSKNLQVNVNASLPAGGNVIGAVTQSGTWNVGTVSTLPSLVAGSAVIGGVKLVDTAGTNQATISAAGAVKVDGSAVTQPVSGTVSSNATQVGTWTVQPGNTPNTTPWLATIQQGGNAATVSAGGALKVDGSAVTQPVSGTVSINAIPTGGNVIGAVTQSGTWNVGLSTGTNTVGSVSLVPKTSGGTTPYSYIAAASANQDSQVVKGSAGQLYGLCLYNNIATARYVKVYDKASAPTSSDTPKFRFILNGTQGAGSCREFTNGVAFASGIAFRITTGIGDSDTGAATANDAIVNAEYN